MFQIGEELYHIRFVGFFVGHWLQMVPVFCGYGTVSSRFINSFTRWRQTLTLNPETKLTIEHGINPTKLAIQVQLSFRTEFLNLAVPLTVLESVGYKYLLSKWLKLVSQRKKY